MSVSRADLATVGLCQRRLGTQKSLGGCAFHFFSVLSLKPSSQGRTQPGARETLGHTFITTITSYLSSFSIHSAEVRTVQHSGEASTLTAEDERQPVRSGGSDMGPWTHGIGASISLLLVLYITAAISSSSCFRRDKGYTLSISLVSGCSAKLFLKFGHAL